MMRILLADDQTLIRQGIRGLLELDTEFQIIAEAGDGDEALKLTLELKPDVALLDVRMPGKDGVQVVQALRKRGDTTPVILLTTFDDDAVLLDGVRAGISGYLLKDVSLEVLSQALRTVVAGKTLILPAVTERASKSVQKKGTRFEAAEMPDVLTDREREVLRLMAGGYSNREIADALGTAEGTVKNQASSILSKLGVRDRTRAVLKALEMGWLVER
ncbi:MAG: response regulator transcription factor [Archangiaceae bacterium]|nr:response regulator transcription factor [Archangiaceae bacterium]